MLRHILFFLVAVAFLAGALSSIIEDVERESFPLEDELQSDKPSPDSLRSGYHPGGAGIRLVEVKICDLKSHLHGLGFLGRGNELADQNADDWQKSDTLTAIWTDVESSSDYSAKPPAARVTLGEDGVIQLDRSLAYLLSFLARHNGRQSTVYCFFSNTFGLQHHSELSELGLESTEFSRTAPEE